MTLFQLPKLYSTDYDMACMMNWNTVKKAAAVTCFNELSRHYPKGTEKNQERSLSVTNHLTGI
jgi:hypothetical protein